MVDQDSRVNKIPVPRLPCFFVVEVNKIIVFLPCFPSSSNRLSGDADIIVSPDVVRTDPVFSNAHDDGRSAGSSSPNSKWAVGPLGVGGRTRVSAGGAQEVPVRRGLPSDGGRSFC